MFSRRLYDIIIIIIIIIIILHIELIKLHLHSTCISKSWYLIKRTSVPFLLFVSAWDFRQTNFCSISFSLLPHYLIALFSHYLVH
jgi:hypothetical protein